jgi:hypothetical protein
MEESVEVICYGIGICRNEVGSFSRYEPPQANIHILVQFRCWKNWTNFKFAGRRTGYSLLYGSWFKDCYICHLVFAGKVNMAV